ncbi:MAG TPA: HDOD domain-containing protein [Clostridiaceae bacterium]|jgi:putative nucleotidyltransferase with HDIG domain|nr:HDOD domain-containing protein [Clostridiaceae bacterium]
MQNHTTIELIRRSESLPPIPKAFGETLSMLLEPLEFNIDECIDKLSGLPRLEKALIQVLNYSTILNRKFLTLKDAVLYLGAQNIRMIAIAFLTGLLLPEKEGKSKIFDSRKYWKHCISTAIAGYMLAEETGLCDKERIFTYGLIHDIGLTVLDICLPDLLDKVCTMHMEKGVHQIVAEKIVLGGITHSDIGMWVCKEWGLPEEIVEIVGYHHSPLVSCKAEKEVKIMYIADYVSASYYESLLGTGFSFTYVDPVRKSLNLSEKFIDTIVEKLPERVESISRVSFFELE